MTRTAPSVSGTTTSSTTSPAKSPATMAGCWAAAGRRRATANPMSVHGSSSPPTTAVARPSYGKPSATTAINPSSAITTRLAAKTTSGRVDSIGRRLSPREARMDIP